MSRKRKTRPDGSLYSSDPRERMRQLQEDGKVGAEFGRLGGRPTNAHRFAKGLLSGPLRETVLGEERQIGVVEGSACESGSSLELQPQITQEEWGLAFVAFRDKLVQRRVELADARQAIDRELRGIGKVLEGLKLVVGTTKKEGRMAVKLEEFEFTSDRSVYPWDDWMDGSIWRTTEGDDFYGTGGAFTSTLRSKARAAGVDVQVQKFQEKGRERVVFQFVPIAEEQPERPREYPPVIAAAS